MQRVALKSAFALLLVSMFAGSAAAFVAPALSGSPANVAAQQDARLATLERQVADAQRQSAAVQQQLAAAKGSGDNAWILTSAALVLFMTGPGLALFYGGLVRRKNVLATMMQSFVLMAAISVLWAVVVSSNSSCSLDRSPARAGPAWSFGGTLGGGSPRACRLCSGE